MGKRKAEESELEKWHHAKAQQPLLILKVEWSLEPGNTGGLKCRKRKENRISPGASRRNTDLLTP